MHENNKFAKIRKVGVLVKIELKLPRGWWECKLSSKTSCIFKKNKIKNKTGSVMLLEYLQEPLYWALYY
jgi:hypothetical protein